MSEIEKEILEVTGARKQKPTEKRPTFLKRLVEKVTELEEDDWDKLSTEAQEWSNEGAKALNKDKQVPDFPDIEEDEEDEDESEAEDETTEAEDEDEEDEDEEDEDEEDEDEEKPRKKAASSSRTKTRRTSAKKDTKAKAKASSKEKPKKPAKESKKKTGEISITDAIKLEMLEDPNLSTGDLEKIMEEKGFKTSRFTISSIRADFKHSLKFLSKNGMLDKKISDRLSS